ncbi:MAG: hypothetical protein M1358_08610 [Chloroflexi bacterium]|nr:hypothetical protein [Chloroflexota bacterium]
MDITIRLLSPEGKQIRIIKSSTILLANNTQEQPEQPAVTAFPRLFHDGTAPTQPGVVTPKAELVIR